MAYKEKRRERRYKVHMSCIVGNNEEMRVLDVSRHGISLLGSTMILEQEPVNIRVAADGFFVEIRAQVSNVTRADGKVRFGMEIVSSDSSWDDLIYSIMIKHITGKET